ncbi:MAG TPA: class I lanthipeptide [Thermoanaerobaculia bacterium]|jgi:hypothetical protein|nr:class I lanthipeptide [Thermoanaerobaculia bacterium]
MNKKSKKLSLSRETLQTLNRDRLSEAAGGVSSWPGPCSCTCYTCNEASGQSQCIECSTTG